MIINVIKYLTKLVKNDSGDYEEVFTNKYKILKTEIDHIGTFHETMSDSGRIYKNRCILRLEDNWVEVNHSFDELMKMKYGNKIGYGSQGKNKKNS
jgi:hypothetical protein